MVSELRIRFKTFGPLRKQLGARVTEIEVPKHSTVRTVIAHVIERGGRAVEKLIMNNKELDGNLVILLNMRDIEALDGQDTLVQDGDEVTLLPHVQGG